MWFRLVPSSLAAYRFVLLGRPRRTVHRTDRDPVGRDGTQLLGWSWDETGPLAPSSAVGLDGV